MFKACDDGQQGGLHSMMRPERPLILQKPKHLVQQEAKDFQMSCSLQIAATSVQAFVKISRRNNFHPEWLATSASGSNASMRKGMR